MSDEDKLREALRDTAQATVTALDRLILAEAVCRAAEAFQRVVDDVLITKADSELARPLRLALDAWTKGKPS